MEIYLLNSYYISIFEIASPEPAMSDEARLLRFARNDTSEGARNDTSEGARNDTSEGARNDTQRKSIIAVRVGGLEKIKSSDKSGNLQ